MEGSVFDTPYFGAMGSGLPRERTWSVSCRNRRPGGGDSLGYEPPHSLLFIRGQAFVDAVRRQIDPRRYQIVRYLEILPNPANPANPNSSLVSRQRADKEIRDALIEWFASDDVAQADPKLHLMVRRRIDSLPEVAKLLEENARVNGWETSAVRDDPEKACVRAALIGREVSEMIEELRNDNKVSEKEEWADIFIRLLSYAEERAFAEEIPAIVAKKIEFNQTRPYKHGGKLF